MSLLKDAALWSQDDCKVDQGREHKAVEEQQGFDDGQQQPAGRRHQSHVCDVHMS